MSGTSLREAILLLAIASANGGLSMRLLAPMLPRLSTAFGTSISAAASVITAYALGATIGTLAYGPLGDRFGKLRMTAVALSGAGLASLGCTLTLGVGSLAVLRFVTGFFGSASMTLGMAYVGDRVSAAERQQTIARFVAGTVTGQSMGPLFGGLMTDLLGWRGTFAVLGIAFLAISALLFARTRAQWAEEAPIRAGGNPFTSHIRLLAFRRVRYVLATTIADTFLFFGAYAFLAPFLKLKFGLSLTLIGAILAGFGAGGLLYTMTVGPLLRRLGQRGLVTWGGAICCASFALVTLSPYWQVAPLCTIAMGFSFYMLHNTIQVKATEMAPQARGTAISIFSAFWCLGQATGVAAMGQTIRFLPYAPAIIGFGCGFLLLGVLLRGNLHRLS